MRPGPRRLRLEAVAAADGIVASAADWGARAKDGVRSQISANEAATDAAILLATSARDASLVRIAAESAAEAEASVAEARRSFQHDTVRLTAALTAASRLTAVRHAQRITKLTRQRCNY